MHCHSPRSFAAAVLLLVGACGNERSGDFTTPDPTAVPPTIDASVDVGALEAGGASDGSVLMIEDSAPNPGPDAAADAGAAGVVDTGADADADSGPPLCGSVACDPHASTCCVPADGGLSGYECLATTTAVCPAGFGTFHCLQQSDCSGGLVCCGSYSLANAVAETQCLAGPCATAQLCKTDAECQNHQSCTLQTCLGRAVLQLCGVQSALGCVPH